MHPCPQAHARKIALFNGRKKYSGWGTTGKIKGNARTRQCSAQDHKSCLFCFNCSNLSLCEKSHTYHNLPLQVFIIEISPNRESCCVYRNRIELTLKVCAATPFFPLYLMDLFLCHYSQRCVLVYLQSIRPIPLDWRPTFAMRPCKVEALKYHTDLGVPFWFIFPWHSVLRWDFSTVGHLTEILAL